ELDHLDAPPRRLVVLGGDGPACYWAQQLHRLGSEVHLVAAGPRLLEAADERVSEIVTQQLQTEDVRVYTGCDGIVLDRTGNRRGVLLCRNGQREKLLTDEVLACPSPQPRLAGLALETAAVNYNERGIAVDAWLRTSERHVFAAGGACGREFASPEAEEATGRLAARNALAWLPRRLSRCVVPRYTPTDPPVVELGLRAAEAAALGIDTDPRRIDFRVPSSAGPGERRGFLAVLLDGSRRPVGATIVAAGAEELALPLMLVMSRRLPLTALGALTPCRTGLARLLAELAH
ncbi:MAG: FAD-dependent oxidoreductase, partial [Thermoguttaceae bacterium]